MTELRYHERDKPVPDGWRVVGPVPGHHGLRYVLLERIASPCA
jgi:hypothetical protein